MFLFAGGFYLVFIGGKIFGREFFFCTNGNLCSNSSFEAVKGFFSLFFKSVELGEKNFWHFIEMPGEPGKKKIGSSSFKKNSLRKCWNLGQRERKKMRNKKSNFGDAKRIVQQNGDYKELINLVVFHGSLRCTNFVIRVVHWITFSWGMQKYPYFFPWSAPGPKSVIILFFVRKCWKKIISSYLHAPVFKHAHKHMGESYPFLWYALRNNSRSPKVQASILHHMAQMPMHTDLKLKFAFWLTLREHPARFFVSLYFLGSLSGFSGFCFGLLLSELALWSVATFGDSSYLSTAQLFD